MGNSAFFIQRFGHVKLVNPEKSNAFQRRYLLSIWMMYICSGLLLAAFHWKGLIEVPRIEPSEQFRGEEEIFTVLRRSGNGLPRAEQRKLAWLILRESRKYGQDYRLTLAIIKTESSFKSRCTSSKGAKGLMQIKPHVGQAVARDIDIRWEGDETLFNPHLNVKMGLHYLSRLLLRFGDLKVALTAYNFGPTFVRKRLKANRKLPSLYTKKVMKAYQEFSQPSRGT
ncbi:MAG: lytic transglycosylase domain-containing protein [Thermodesulfobacteriota bacterium]